MAQPAYCWTKNSLSLRILPTGVIGYGSPPPPPLAVVVGCYLPLGYRDAITVLLFKSIKNAWGSWALPRLWEGGDGGGKGKRGGEINRSPPPVFRPLDSSVPTPTVQYLFKLRWGFPHHPSKKAIGLERLMGVQTLWSINLTKIFPRHQAVPYLMITMMSLIRSIGDFSSTVTKCPELTD